MSAVTSVNSTYFCTLPRGMDFKNSGLHSCSSSNRSLHALKSPVSYDIIRITHSVRLCALQLLGWIESTALWISTLLPGWELPPLRVNLYTRDIVPHWIIVPFANPPRPSNTIEQNHRNQCKHIHNYTMHNDICWLRESWYLAVRLSVVLLRFGSWTIVMQVMQGLNYSVNSGSSFTHLSALPRRTRQWSQQSMHNPDCYN